MIRILNTVETDSGSWCSMTSEGWTDFKSGGDPKDGSDGDDGA